MIDRFELFSSSVASLYRYVQKIERAEMSRYGLKGPHAQCLIAMYRFPEGITAARLSEICEKDKAAISRAIAELEQEGLIVRNSANGTRYRALLQLTDAGRQATEAVREKAARAVELAGAGMTQEQRETLYQTMALIADNLSKICREGLQTE